jgi:hypothetical protein
MSFWKTQLIKNLEAGELPVIKAEVTIEKTTLFNLGVVLVAVAAAVILISAGIKALRT